MIQEFADLVCQDTQTGDLHCVDIFLSWFGGGKCKEVHVRASTICHFLRREK